jgi:hypothetical protein
MPTNTPSPSLSNQKVLLGNGGVVVDYDLLFVV